MKIDNTKKNLKLLNLSCYLLTILKLNCEYINLKFYLYHNFLV